TSTGRCPAQDHRVDSERGEDRRQIRPEERGRPLLHDDRLPGAAPQARIDFHPGRPDLELQHRRDLLRPDAGVGGPLEGDRREEDRDVRLPGGVEEAAGRGHLGGEIRAESRPRVGEADREVDDQHGGPGTAEDAAAQTGTGVGMARGGSAFHRAELPATTPRAAPRGLVYGCRTSGYSRTSMRRPSSADDAQTINAPRWVLAIS